jgi:3-phenylpropionate/cinnamic acid dioxygenase small subunit
LTGRATVAGVASPAPEHSARLIENLIVEYAALVDAGDFRGLGELLADSVFGGEGDAVVSGGPAIEKLFRSLVRTYDDGTPRTKHVTTNIHIDVDDEAGTAVSRSYVTVLQALPDLPLQPIVAGRYRDLFAYREGAWRFVERRFTTDLVGDVSRHLRGGPAALAT